MCFYANLGHHFYPDFQGFCPEYQQIKTVAGVLATSAPPSPTPLFFVTVSLGISWFIKIDLKQIYCSYSGTQKIQNDFLQFVLLFLRSTLLMNRNKHNRQRYFYKFPLPSTVLLLPLAYRCSGVPEHACCVGKLRQNVGLQT